MWSDYKSLASALSRRKFCHNVAEKLTYHALVPGSGEFAWSVEQRI